jgi:hypothetical protein
VNETSTAGAEPRQPAIARLGEAPAYPLWAFIAGAVLIPSLYLHNLTTPFDFSDDGALAYAVRATDTADWFRRVWQEKVIADFVGRGPFRPTYWFFTQAPATLFGPVALQWRLFYFAWSVVAAASMLLLMRELRICLAAALCVTALAMWNFSRGEVWTHFGLGENIAMPLTCLALVCACRAGRSHRPLGWDLCGFVCALAAIATKNVFMVIVPAQVLLRIAPDGTDILAGLRKHWLAAVFLASTLLLPFGHLLAYSAQWRPGQYTYGAPTLDGVRRVVFGYFKAMGLLFLAPALVLAVLALAGSKRQSGRTGTIITATQCGLIDVYRAHRAAFLAGALLAAGGAAVYLPVGVGGGRYSLPGTLGLDMALAALLSMFFALQPSQLKRAGVVALAIGLLIAAAGGWTKVERMIAWQKVLTDALNHVERNAPRGSSVVWYLADADGTHFEWHLQGRGREDLLLNLAGEDAGRQASASKKLGPPAFAIGDNPSSPAGGPWSAPTVFERATWFNFARYKVFVWPARRAG